MKNKNKNFFLIYLIIFLFKILYALILINNLFKNHKFLFLKFICSINNNNNLLIKKFKHNFSKKNGR